MPKTFEKKIGNVHQLTRELSLWTEHYRKWAQSPVATQEAKEAFDLLDKVTQDMVQLFGDPSNFDE